MAIASLGIVGMVLLVVGATLLVAGASGLASRVGISPLVVGLTVVAFGTSAPELAVSVRAAALGDGAIAVGNVLGSNVFNVLGILGLTALIVPQAVDVQVVRRDAPLLVAISGATWWLLRDGRLGMVGASAMLAVMVGYLVHLVVASRRAAANVDTSTEAPAWPVPAQLAAVAGGLAMLVFGADLTVDAAVALATALGLSQAVIGVTVVAAATSLPELATSVVAALRGEREIAVGNVVGSNVFNLLVVLAAGGLAAPGGLPVLPQQLAVDVPAMFGSALLLWVVLHTGRRVVRAEGALLITLLAALWTWQVLDALGDPAAARVGYALGYVVVPAVSVVLAIGVAQQWRASHRPIR